MNITDETGRRVRVTERQKQALAAMTAGPIYSKRRGYGENGEISRTTLARLIDLGLVRRIGGPTQGIAITERGKNMVGELDQSIDVTDTAALLRNSAPRPWVLVSSGKQGGNGRHNYYIVDANRRKICAVWGRDGEREATGELICKMANEAT
jgi:hypothetical protein